MESVKTMETQRAFAGIKFSFHDFDQRHSLLSILENNRLMGLYDRQIQNGTN